MGDSAPIPTAGSLSAKVIRACKIHNNKCKLDCPKREVEDLGEIARFDTRVEVAEEQSWRDKFVGWMHQFSEGKEHS